MHEQTTDAPPIVLIHGLWMTPRSWDRWTEYYRAKGYEVITPAYPGSRSRWRRSASGSWVWAYGLIANRKPGHQETWVDFDLDDRAPLLFIIGGKDHMMPPSVIRSNAKKYRNSEALTETYEFPDRSHFTGVEPGWEQVADYALAWETSHAGTRQS